MKKINSLSTYIHNQSETTHYTIPIALLPSSKYILYNIYLYSSNPSIDIHYSNNDNNEDNNTNIQSNDILDSTEHSFNIYIPLSISTEDQNYTINNSAKNDNNISYNEKNQSLIHIKGEHKIMKTETNNMIYNTNNIRNNNNTNENNMAYTNNMVFISTINNISSLNNTVITTNNNNINNNFIIPNNTNINNNFIIATNNNIYIPNATTITISTLLNPIHITVSNSLPPTSYTIHSLSNLHNITSLSMTSESLSSYHNNSSDMNHLTNSNITTTIITIFLNSRLTIKTNFYYNNNNNNNNTNINNNEAITYPISPSFLSSTDINKDISNINDIIDVNTTANNNSNNNKNIKNDENDYYLLFILY
ncbi:hypothetical protein WA158_006994 [Blastocystis sp. Blastoise]